MPRRRHTRAGFTLIELMTVLAIVGLLAMIAMPKLTNLKGRAQVVAMKSDLRNLVTLEENYFAQHLKYATARPRAPRLGARPSRHRLLHRTPAPRAAASRACCSAESVFLMLISSEMWARFTSRSTPRTSSTCASAAT